MTYRHILAARFGVGLTNEPIETTTLHFLKNLSSWFQLWLSRVQDAQQ